jgi:hypothetical protein
MRNNLFYALLHQDHAAHGLPQVQNLKYKPLLWITYTSRPETGAAICAPTSADMALSA